MNQTQNRNEGAGDARSDTRRLTLIRNIRPGMMVYTLEEGEIGHPGGKHIGTVDHLDGDNSIKLKKRDSADGKHHWVPINWVQSVSDDAVYLNKSEDELDAEVMSERPVSEENWG